MSGVITASEPSWIAPFTGLSSRQFGKLMTALRREGADPVRKGRPWSLSLEDRVLLVAAYWRTNLTLRQLAPLFGVSKSTANRVIVHLGPSLALQQRRRFRTDAVLIVDGTLVPTRDHTIAEQSKNYPYSTNHQVVIDADSQLVVAVGRPLPGNRNDCKAWERSGKVRARVEHVFARMKAWKILRDCRLKGSGVHTAMLGIARLYILALAG
ncbi:IS5/IS1182 family transposase [Streptomyces sp. MPA0124]|uniref:IS5/IS1182 family transposase n=1 Tax=unclassified Streptomyces TaxID=2593676 RepID=UPI00052AA536|nr:IS5/IS1182 family transposase [Streptomyces sp. CCM_MD2014]AIV32134.1 transposase [Streptomyces sp. CCM_MD2014]MYS50727.1 IS5/IS1182 family transposase [Streptomyces sp. SID6013]